MRIHPLLLALLLGCVSSLSPTVFAVNADKGTVATVQRAIVIQGADVEVADESTGVVQTSWETTGSNSDGTMWVHRFTVTISPRGASSELRVNMDLRTCDNGLGRTPDGRIDGSPCARVPGGIPTSYQTRLDEFGAGVRAELSR